MQILTVNCSEGRFCPYSSLYHGIVKKSRGMVVVCVIFAKKDAKNARFPPTSAGSFAFGLDFTFYI
jgi:hypothetical protein